MSRMPRNLNINPLSVVKFFYEKLGEIATEQPFIHPALYLTYLEVLRKENLILFKEDFENWENIPVLPSVFNFLESNSPQALQKTKDITNQVVISHLENICHRYSKKNDKLLACELQFKVQKSIASQ